MVVPNLDRPLSAKSNEENPVYHSQPRFADSHIWLEYFEFDDPDQHFRYRLDMNHHWNPGVNDLGKHVGLFMSSSDYSKTLWSGDRVIQFCQNNRKCGEDQDNNPGNHFDGKDQACRTNNSWRWCFGGNLSGTGTTIWVKRHPQPTHTENVLHLRARIERNYSNIRSIRAYFHEIGFKDSTPAVEPRMGFWDQLVVSWDDTKRCRPHTDPNPDKARNTVPQNCSRFNADQHYFWDSIWNQPSFRDDIYWVYHIHYTDDPNDDLKGTTTATDDDWHRESLGWRGRIDTDTTNRRYQATIGSYGIDEDGHKQASSGTSGLLADRYQPETEIYIALQLKQDRFGQRLYDFSDPTRFFLPGQLLLLQQNQTIKTAWSNTYTDPIDQYQYRIGHQERGQRQTSFSTQDADNSFQPASWINICDTDLTEDTSGNQTQTITLISSTQPHPSNDCGGDPDHPLLPDTPYRIQIRAVDESRTENPHVRNYVHPETLSLDGPPQRPSGLDAQPTHNQLAISWNMITSTTPLTQTEYRTGAPNEDDTGTTWTEWATLDTPTGTNVVITGLIPETQYTFELRASNQHGQSPTATAMATTTEEPPPPTTPPPAASGGGGGGGGFFPTPGGSPPATGGEPPGDETPTPTGNGFTDSNGHTHETNIIALAEMGVTRGCNPPENSRFCPDRAVTRGEMATFLVRAFELPTTDDDPFTDTSGNVHRTNIDRMAAAGISRGCNPPTNTRFCPDRAVTRAEMATFMTRVLQLEEEGTGFNDTNGNIHATNISRFANAGITRGCNPPENSRYCPERAVTRAEMATFLVRSTALNNS